MNDLPPLQSNHDKRAKIRRILEKFASAVIANQVELTNTLIDKALTEIIQEK